MKKMLLILITSIILLGCDGGAATGPVLSTMSSLTASSILDDLKNTIQESIAKAEYSYNASVNNTANQLEYSVSVLSEEIKSNTDNIDDKITQQQYLALENLTKVISDFDTKIKENIILVEDLVLTSGQILKDLPFSNKESRITNVNIPFYVKNWTNNLNISFKGLGLDNMKNTIMIGDEVYKPTDQTSTQINFIVSGEEIEKILKNSKSGLKDTVIQNSENLITDKVYYLKGKSVTHYEEGWWIFKRTYKKEHPFTIKILPKIIGSIEVFYSSDLNMVNEEKVKTHKCDVSTGSPGWRGGTKENEETCNFHTPKKYSKACRKEVRGTIKPGSLKIKRDANRHGGGHSLKSVTDKSFTIKVGAKSQSRPGGGGGFYSAHAEYIVVYNCMINEDLTFPVKNLEIGGDFFYTLNKNGNEKFINAVIKYFDGTTKILINGNNKSELVNVTPDQHQVAINVLSIPR